MKFDIKNLLNKKSIKKLEKATLVGVASLALIIPLGMSGNGSAHAFALPNKSRSYYYDILVNPSDAMMTNSDEMENLWVHPYLKHTHAARTFFKDSFVWDGDADDTYAHHFKQLYTPYLYPVMPKRIPRNTSNYKRDNYLLHKGQEQLGLLGNCKRTHRVRRARKPRYHYHAGRQTRRHHIRRHYVRYHYNRPTRQTHKKSRRTITYWFN